MVFDIRVTVKTYDPSIFDILLFFLSIHFSKILQVMSQASIGRPSWMQRHVIVVSDGMFTDLYPAMTQAFKMQVQGMRIMAAGVGSTVSHNNLLNICNRQVSDPTGVHSADNDDLLNTVRKGTTHPDCKSKINIELHVFRNLSLSLSLALSLSLSFLISP